MNKNYVDKVLVSSYYNIWLVDANYNFRKDARRRQASIVSHIELVNTNTKMPCIWEGRNE